MSDVMLHGVLNMPIDIWGDDHLGKIQRHARYVQASKLITSQQEDIEDLKAVALKAQQELGQLKARLGAVEPVAFAIYAPSGNIRIWWSAGRDGRNERAEKWAAANNETLVPLYAAPVPSQKKPHGFLLEHSEGTAFYNLRGAAESDAEKYQGSTITPVYL